MKRIYYNIMCAIGAICGFSSCGDFLEIEPQNEIIHENFWNEKADVDGIVAGIRSGMSVYMLMTVDGNMQNSRANDITTP